MAHGLHVEMASPDLHLYFLLSTLLYSTIGQKVRAVKFLGQTVPRLEFQPQFLAPLENHTVSQGRNVFFTCVVNHLQSYKVAWIKSDSRAILAIHTHMVAPNPRLSVTHNGHNTWKLHVVNVQPNDSGTYMCQVNTEPMRSQIGHMKVVIPPDILDLDDSSNRLTSIEGGDIRLRCRATGNPKPEVSWRREDGRSIVIRSDNGRTLVVKTYKDENLSLTGILKQEMGSYLCIASNGVPPTVSKRHYVNVFFKPMIKIKYQVEFAQINHDVTLECRIESSPKSFTIWYTENGLKVVFDERHVTTETAVNHYTFQVNLTIRRIRSSDFRIYTCFTENSFGKTRAVIRLREQHLVRTTIAPFHLTTDKKYIMKTSGKRRNANNDLSSGDKLFKFNSGRLITSFKDNMTSPTRNNDGEYSNFPKDLGTHYDSTFSPGSYYFNSAPSIKERKQTTSIIKAYLAIFAVILS